MPLLVVSRAAHNERDDDGGVRRRPGSGQPYRWDGVRAARPVRRTTTTTA